MINQLQKNKIINILRKNQIQFAGLFGSQAKGEASKNSDFDILLEFDKNKKYSLFDIVQVKNDLEDSLHAPFDVVTTAGLNKKMKNEVLKSMVVLYDERK